MHVKLLLLAALYLSPIVIIESEAQAPNPRPGPSTAVTIVNTTPVPVSVPGGVTVSGGVTITNTPNVSVTNTPNVNVANTPSVSIANTPAVQAKQSGAWSVGVTGPVSLAAGTAVAVTSTLPAQPYVFTEEFASGPVVGSYFVERVFGPVAANVRLAISTAVFTSLNANNIRGMWVYTDDCNGNGEVLYLAPATTPGTTVAVFPHR